LPVFVILCHLLLADCWSTHEN